MDRRAVRVAVVTSPQPKPWMEEKALEGEYYFGDGLGVNCSLELKENHRFAFRWSGCLGEYDRNSGRWEWEGDVMVFKPEHKNDTKGFSGMNLRFIPVAWGQRVYLIDEYELPGFCAGIKQRGGRFQTRELHGLDYVKVGKRGELPPLSGEPRVPPRYQEFVRHGEIKATVVRVQGNGTLVKEQGVPRLKVGMRLCFDDFKNGPDRIVQSVRGQEAIVVAVGSAAHTTPVKPGALLTTGNYWKRPTGTGRK